MQIRYAGELLTVDVLEHDEDDENQPYLFACGEGSDLARINGEPADSGWWITRSSYEIVSSD